MEYELTDSEGITIFAPRVPALDQNNAQAVLDPLGPAIEAGKPVVLDLSAVNFISSAGLGSIVGMIRDSRLKGGVVRLCSPSPTVRALFTMVHIESIVPVDDDRDSSLAVLASAHG